ncbi:MAG: hypothetical protein ACPLKZ_05695, partial [Candidatus Bathyarchaeales archaeon]
MKRTAVLSIVLILLILAALFFISHSISSNNKEAPSDFYVGVTFCGNTTTEAKLLIDKVKGYTNLFVLQSWPISNNETATTEICDYAVAAGLNIIVNLGINWSYSRVWTWQFP